MKSINLGRTVYVPTISCKNGTLVGRTCRSIRGYDYKYLISNYGEVISFGRYKEGYILSNTVIKGGYETVRLWLEGRTDNWLVHRLVALAFIDNPKDLPEVNHIDEDKCNNTVDNLEWVTRSQNIQHSVEKYRGENKNFSTIDEEKAGNIKWMLSNTGLSQYKIADTLGVTRSIVSHICYGNSWQWVEPLKPVTGE